MYRTMAERIRRARRVAGLTQRAVAAALGVGRSAVAQWELEPGTRPSEANLRALAALLGCPRDWLAGVSESQRASTQLLLAARAAVPAAESVQLPVA